MNRIYLVLGVITFLILSNTIVLIGGTNANTGTNELIDYKSSITRCGTNLSYEESSNGLPTSGQWPYATRVGDLDNDGDMDIIRLRGHDDFNSEDQGFQIWLGDGTGSWTKTNIPNGNFGYGGTALGDFNNDGYLDGAYGVHHNRNHPLIGAWAGDGGTSFTEKSNGLATDGETWGMAPIDFGDFNNDGYLDIGVGSFGSGNGIRAYKNNNGGNSWDSESNGLPYYGNYGDWLIWDDINRDGWLDIFGSSDQGLIWLGDGTGQWNGNDYGLPNQWTGGLDVGDINNDGWTDITLIKHIESGNDDWYVPIIYTFDGDSWTDASNGLPNISNYPEVHFDPLSFGDLNNDGFLDLVGLEGYYTGSWPNTLEWTTIHAWLGDGTGKWTEIDEVDTDIPGWPQSVMLADIDHNDYLDIVISSERDSYEPGGVRVYKNTNPAGELNITLRKPFGGEVFIEDGVQIVKWTTSIPTGTPSITLQYSMMREQGPWYNIEDNITDSNYYQWTIPKVNTGSGAIKATVYCNGQNYSTINKRSFTIFDGANFPPNSPKNPDPADEATNVDVNTDLSWSCSDPEGDTLVYDVYFKANDPNPEILVSEDQSNTTYDPGILANGTTYYWQIVAKDSHGGITAGPIWEFTTEGLTNNPPNPPIINGLTHTKVGVEYDYNFSLSDPNKDKMYLRVDWGSGTPSKWYGSYTSGTIVKLNHSWNKKGTYIIKAQAKDIYDAESDWGELEVTAPRNRMKINNLFLEIFSRFSNLFPILRQLIG